MWSSSKTSSQGGTLRRILKIAFASTVAIFLWLGFINSIPAHAASAEWSGNSNISYNDRNFTLSGTADGTKPPGIPKESPIYVNIDGKKASVIYLSPDADTSNPTNGNIKTFDYVASSSTFSNPSASSPIELPAQEEPEQVSCSVGLGMGWLLCPITDSLANAMDYLFGIVTGFLEVQPLNVNNTDDNLFRAWDAMRQIANVAFIIVFLILIYSQLTSFGVSTYGIKKMLPNIIVGAILVNLSWIIAAAAVDLSNIIGYALQDFFMGLRDNLFTFTAEDNGKLTSWSSLSQVILSGGTAGAAGVLAVLSALPATGGALTAAIWMLLPVLVGLILSVVIVIMIFAARQALIIILIILAPLAFIARILPNTESLYKKWFSTFTTMLVFFPAISLLFGGAQLAGSLIIQSASNLNVVILGMAVQVAPLILAPFVLKLSGGLLGRIGGIINNPKKGVVDRTRGIAEKRAKMHQQRSLAGLDRKGDPLKPSRRRVFRNTARSLDDRNRRLEDNTANYSKMNDARYKGTQKYQDVYQKAYEADQAIKSAEATLERDLKSKVQRDSRLLEIDMNVRLKTKQAELQNLKLDSLYERLAAGETSRYQNLSHIASGSQEAARDLALTAMAKNSSQRVQHTQLSDALLENTETINGEKLRTYAGGADTQYGADSALASAISIQGENDGKLANERAKLISHFNLNGENRQKLAMGEQITTPIFDDKGHSYTFNASTDDYLRSAAVEVQFSKGSAADKLAIIESSGINTNGTQGVNYDIRTDISDLIAKTGVPNSIAWLGGVSMDKVTRGEVGDEKSLKRLAFEHIKGGRFKAEQWFTNDAIAIEYALDVMKNPDAFNEGDGKDLIKFHEGVESLKSKLKATRKNDNITSRSSDGTLKEIDKLINF